MLVILHTDKGIRIIKCSTGLIFTHLFIQPFDGVPDFLVEMCAFAILEAEILVVYQNPHL